MYYHMHEDTNNRGHYMIGSANLHRRVRWLSGKPHPIAIAEPIRFPLEDRFGTNLPDLLDSGSGVLMSKKLVDGLRAAGVDNFETYEAILEDSKRKVEFSSHLAVQVIGRVAAVDSASSEGFDPMNVGHTLVQYRKLVIDPNAAKGLRMFRLHESVTTIIVHEDVKKTVEPLGLNGILFDPVG